MKRRDDGQINNRMYGWMDGWVGGFMKVLVNYWTNGMIATSEKNNAEKRLCSLTSAKRTKGQCVVRMKAVRSANDFLLEKQFQKHFCFSVRFVKNSSTQSSAKLRETRTTRRAFRYFHLRQCFRVSN